MNVLTLTTKEQVDKYSSSSCKLLREGNYDKVIFKGITDLPEKCIGLRNPWDYLNYVPEIEVQNCTITDYIIINSVKTPLKIIIKDSIIQGFNISDVLTSFSMVLDNVTQESSSISAVIRPQNGSYTGNKSLLSFKNSKLNIRLMADIDTCDIELSNNHDMAAFAMPVSYIPDEEAELSKFLSQFRGLTTTVMPSKIDRFNYQFDQADWDKLISLLDRYPNLFQSISFDPSFGNLLRGIRDNDIYIHIPSLTFPLGWINSLDYNDIPSWLDLYNSVSYKDYARFYVNKNNGYNFTITHIDEFTGWGSQYQLQGILIADNYEDIMAANRDHVNSLGVNGSAYTLYYHKPIINFLNILSGKMVTTEITLLPNTYSVIRTVGSDMKIKRIKEVTRFHGKTIKVTGMGPLILLSVAGTRCFDIDGVVEIDRADSESKAFINGSITVKMLYMADINGNATIQPETHTDIIGSVAINQIKSFIDGDVSIKAVRGNIIDGTISTVAPSPEVGIDGYITVAGIEKFITGMVNVYPIISMTVTGKIAVNLIDYDLDGLFQLAQAVSADIIGDIDVRVCRVEILGYFEIPMEEVWG